MKKKNQCSILLVWHTQAKKQTNTEQHTYLHKHKGCVQNVSVFNILNFII